ncbi:uncharacterized protein ACA1_396260 [Acanthamoeba castellanii str. Neff]|uniref:Uncharacterized protein n=1 Tax=Acanthamoeba castellanii (strain ATCC 30010 / Neff) TaxID=1257118 RepID=L8HCB9_ACACF|nr:uncharacterized protein ACA1_396260 [Acanthamoeba castellanii str. Neff]ELR22840.1 hypothetical protein ACA1_396260 [Acanthamoeba castellanii str. Neff]
MTTLEITLDRFDRKYRPGDVVTGKVEVVCEKEGEQHTGVTLGVEGLVSLDPGGLRLGSAARTTQNLVQTHQLAPGGKLYAPPPLCFLWAHFFFWLPSTVKGMNEFPFQMQKEAEFVIHVDTLEEVPQPREVSILLSSNESSQFKQGKGATSDEEFSARGKFLTTTCHVNKPLSGELTVETTVGWAIDHASLHLMRIETVAKEGGGFNKQVSEIQTTQLVDGYIPDRLAVPIYLVFPRLFTCPSLHAANFKIEFSVTLQVTLKGGHVLKKDFPLLLVRK